MMQFCKSVVTRMLALGWPVGLLLAVSLGTADAQSLRDPTVPPVEAGLGNAGPDAKPFSGEPGAMTVIVRNGRPHLVVGTRLYAEGQMLGRVRIERITETEVWLREGGVLRKVSQFSGIQRRTAAPSSKTSYPVAPRTGVQP
ncbi:hypothetical protein [Rhodoferax sp.]|uniref:hypothetical protein n=1 Tax=Rhodoferax sp. TaxID=50421 RepID=UPI00272D3835|nr:hypothetical protein [Rhodoferax sp.]